MRVYLYIWELNKIELKNVKISFVEIGPRSQLQIINCVTFFKLNFQVEKK